MHEHVRLGAPRAAPGHPRYAIQTKMLLPIHRRHPFRTQMCYPGHMVHPWKWKSFPSDREVARLYAFLQKCVKSTIFKCVCVYRHNYTYTYNICRTMWALDSHRNHSTVKKHGLARLYAFLQKYVKSTTFKCVCVYT